METKHIVMFTEGELRFILDSMCYVAANINKRIKRDHNAELEPYYQTAHDIRDKIRMEFELQRMGDRACQ